MENWATKTNQTIDSKLEGIKDKDLRFYRIDELKRNIERVETFSKSCPYCKKRKIDISTTIEKIDEAVNVPGQTRREYDRMIGRLSIHMQKEHGFYTPFHFVYLYSFFGMVAGLLLGYLLLKILPQYDWTMLAVGFSVGLISGYIWGNIKDKKIRSENKLM
ncbi:MAG TPA: hypothetical protein VKA38_10975 [Draconibacterium sp.]|nr:hypothetical protein [Draconibacterium sp.]